MAVLGLGAVAACGAGANPVRAVTTANAVQDAFAGLRSQSGIKLTASLDVTPAQLLQMQKVDNGSGLTPALASAVSGTSVVIDVHTGHGESLKAASNKAAPDKNEQVALSLMVKGSNPVEVRVVNQTIFLRADLAQLLPLYGQDPSKATEALAGLSQLNATVPGIGKLGTGGWVSVTLQQLETMEGKLAKSGSTPAPPKLGSSFMNDVGAVFNRDTSITNNGTHSGRTEYTITAPVKQLVGDLITTVSKDAGTSAAAMASLSGMLNSSIASIPPGLKASVQVWVKDNKAQELDIDLNQFDAKYAFPVPLKIVIGDGDTVAAPAGAAALDLSPLAGMLGQNGLSGALGASSSSS